MSTTSNPVPVGKENSILTVLSVSEVAEYLGVGKNRVYELLPAGAQVLSGSCFGKPKRISCVKGSAYVSM